MDKNAELREKVISKWSDGKSKICEDLEHDYIFGPEATNEHFLRSEIGAIYDEVVNDMQEIDKYMSGSVLIEDAEYDEETGEVVKEAVKETVYYSPTTKVDLLNFVEEDALDLKMAGSTWADFKESYKGDLE